MKFAVIRTGGRQYLVKENQELIVDHIPTDDKEVELQTLATGDTENEIEVGTPNLSGSVKAQIIEHLKGDKIRVMRFKSKVRYRKTQGFRPMLTKIKIVNL
ncbi:MAG TPA: 50S ribosomal protein L21 [Candidatus Nitrosocosmicus sp.]|nr:50S ribosomal protein L21 [Candidatus Nitrosocosmicus sp.]